MSQQTQSLSQWIAVATAGLPPSAVSKISAEIADHAAEARQKHLAEGMSPDEADQTAVRGLGDARQLAVTFRDAHFSRRMYARGAVVTLILLVITGIALLIFSLSPAPDYTYQPPTIHSWVALRQIGYTLARSILFVLMIRAALVLLREQFDIPTPRLGWRLLVASVVLTVVPAVLRQAVSVGYIYNNYLLPLARLTGSDFWYDPHPALSALNQLANLLTWALIGVFCARLLASGASRSRRALTLLLILGTVVGGEILILNVTAFLSLPVDYYMARAAGLLGISQVTFSVVVSTAFNMGVLIPYFALEAMLLGLFIHMRRPGAVVAR